MEGSLFFFFFSKFRERKKEPGINHRDEHSVYAKIEHLEIKQSGGRNGVAMRILTRGESILWSNNRWRNEKKKRGKKERKEERIEREPRERSRANARTIAYGTIERPTTRAHVPPFTMIRRETRKTAFPFPGEQELCEQRGMRPCLCRLHPCGHAAGAK